MRGIEQNRAKRLFKLLIGWVKWSLMLYGMGLVAVNRIAMMAIDALVLFGLHVWTHVAIHLAHLQLFFIGLDC